MFPLTGWAASRANNTAETLKTQHATPPGLAGKLVMYSSLYYFTACDSCLTRASLTVSCLLCFSFCFPHIFDMKTSKSSKWYSSASPGEDNNGATVDLKKRQTCIVLSICYAYAPPVNICVLREMKNVRTTNTFQALGLACELLP